MKRFCALAPVVSLILLPAAPAFSQTNLSGPPTTVTLYSPAKYKLTSAPPLPSGRPRPDASRAYFNFTTGKLRIHGGWDLAYGVISRDKDLDWFMVDAGDDIRTVIKDLGRFEWSDRLKVPVVAALPELKPGEHRLITIDVSGKAGANGRPGANGSLGGFESSGTNREWLQDVWPDITNFEPVRNPTPRKKIVNLPIAAKTVGGHMYVIHVVDSRSDFYVLLHVDGLVRGDNCTVSWQRISTPAQEIRKQRH